MASQRFCLVDEFNKKKIDGYWLWYSDVEDFVKLKKYEKYKIALLEDSGKVGQILFSTFEKNTEEKKEVILFDNKKIIEYINSSISYFDINFKEFDYFEDTGSVIYRFSDNENKLKFISDVTNNTVFICIKNYQTIPELIIQNVDITRFRKEKKIKYKIENVPPIDQNDIAEFNF